MRSLRYFAALGLLAAVVAGPAAAQTTATMDVTATVAPSCRLTSATTMDFGTLNPDADNFATGDIMWECTSGHTGTVSLNAGLFGASVDNRQMDDAGTRLAYNVYTDGGYGTVAGDGSGSSSTLSVIGTGYGTPTALQVFGRVLATAAAAAPAGTYIDEIEATITF